MVRDPRRLVIIRHAKSAWPDGVPDAQRPLNERGRRDAPATGRWFRDRVGHVDTAVCSPAVRARQTWELLAAELDEAPDPIVDDRVYAATADTLLTIVHELPTDARSAVLLGHNPGMSDLVALLSGHTTPMRTSAVAVLDISGSWTDAIPGGAMLVTHATPRG